MSQTIFLLPSYAVEQVHIRHAICHIEWVGAVTRGWTATNMNAQKKLFTGSAIGPIILLALASYRSLTIQVLIFGILDLNFQSEFQQYAGSSLASSVLLCG